jgi:serine/threonine protein kinase
MERVVVGEGGYGCVHKPSLECETMPIPGFDYNDYVSKLMTSKNASTELKEFVTIGRVDPKNEYHLGKPILCKPKLDDEFKHAVAKCNKLSTNGAVTSNPNRFSLLILKDGGVDLQSLCDKKLTKYLETNKEKKTDQFWLEVHHLIKGLLFFKKNNIVHNDIKPQNILFNLEDGSMKYIDFGIMRSKEEIIKTSATNNNGFGIFSWSFPLDCGFMEKNKFDEYAESKKKHLMKMELMAMIINGSKVNRYKFPLNRPRAFKILFTYLNPENVVPDETTQIGYIKSFFDGFNALIEKNNYYQILERITDSIDVYGLGFSLQYIANCFKRHDAIPLNNFLLLSSFLNKMYDFNPSTRVIDIETLLDEYENILLQMGVLTRLNVSFENHNIVKIPAKTIKRQRKIERLSTELQALANEDPIPSVVPSVAVKSCPEGKELNPRTNRCVQKCKPGHSRNEKFQCRSSKSKKRINMVKMSTRNRTRTRRRRRTRR